MYEKCEQCDGKGERLEYSYKKEWDGERLVKCCYCNGRGSVDRDEPYHFWQEDSLWNNPCRS